MRSVLPGPRPQNRPAGSGAAAREANDLPAGALAQAVERTAFALAADQHVGSPRSNDLNDGHRVPPVLAVPANPKNGQGLMRPMGFFRVGGRGAGGRIRRGRVGWVGGVRGRAPHGDHLGGGLTCPSSSVTSRRMFFVPAVKEAREGGGASHFLGEVTITVEIPAQLLDRAIRVVGERLQRHLLADQGRGRRDREAGRRATCLPAAHQR